jgi:alpha-D-xyloside xylohydrolase
VSGAVRGAAIKFTDGFWLMRPGVAATYALAAHRIECTDRAIDVLAATKMVRHRGDTLNAATLGVLLDSPYPNVVRVRVSHHSGGPPPLTFPLDESHNHQVAVAGGGEGSTLTTAELTARVAAAGHDWNLEFAAGDRLVGHQRARSLASVTDAQGRRHLSVQFSLGVGENVYGLGERFTAFVKNGQSIDVWNQDGGTSSEQAYKNIPFYLTNGGYGILVNHTGRVCFEVASEAVERVQFSVEGEQVEYLVIYGPTPKEILRTYTALTGRPPVPPHWSFGLWMSTSFVTDYDEQTVRGFVEAMRQREIPLSVVHFDCFWMREFQWCDFEWDPRTFPDPAAMLARLKADGLRVSLWINPYIGQASPLFEEARAQGFLLRRPDGSVWQWDLWQAGLAVVDFTNPEARQWFQSKLRPLRAMGVDSFKTDFGERIPTDVVYHDGSDPEQMHNLYTQLYNQAVFEVLTEDGGDAVVFARSATVGGQTMPVHWGGDNSSTFESMAESLRGGLSLGLCGFGFWSHDIGGFEGLPDPAVFKRWVAFGLLSSHSRLHGNESVRVPWAFDEEAVEVTRDFTRLKMRLMPYLYSAAHEAAEHGWPMMRAMMLEFPEDRTCLPLDQQYLLGGSLLVAPVFSAAGDVEFYLPRGAWTHLLTGAVVEGPAWVSERHGFDSLPLFVRQGSVLVTGARQDTVDYDYQQDAVVTVYGLAEGVSATATVHTPGGDPPVTFTAVRQDGRLTVTSTGTKSYTVVER